MFGVGKFGHVAPTDSHVDVSHSLNFLFKWVI